MENPVDNVVNIHRVFLWQYITVEIHRVIKRFSASFPRFLNEKRYKLINFAPDLRIVDKVCERLIINKMDKTVYVDKILSDVYIKIYKF